LQTTETTAEVFTTQEVLTTTSEESTVQEESTTQESTVVDSSTQEVTTTQEATTVQEPTLPRQTTTKQMVPQTQDTLPSATEEVTRESPSPTEEVTQNDTPVPTSDSQESTQSDAAEPTQEVSTTEEAVPTDIPEDVEPGDSTLTASDPTLPRTVTTTEAVPTVEQNFNSPAATPTIVQGIAAETTDLPFERTVTISTDGGSLVCSNGECTLGEKGDKFVVTCPDQAIICSEFSVVLRDVLSRRQSDGVCVELSDVGIVPGSCTGDLNGLWRISDFDGVETVIGNAGQNVCLDADNAIVQPGSCETAVKWKVSDVPFAISVAGTSVNSILRTTSRRATSTFTSRKLLLISQLSTTTVRGYGGIASATEAPEIADSMQSITMESISEPADAAVYVVPLVFTIVAGVVATVTAVITIFSASASATGITALTVPTVGAAGTAGTSFWQTLFRPPIIPKPAQSPHVVNQTPGFVDMVILCQSVVGLGLIDGLAPLFFTSFTENFWWSMGVFKFPILTYAASSLFSEEQNAYWEVNLWSNGTATIPGTIVTKRTEVNSQAVSSIEVVCHLLGVPAQTLFAVVLISFVCVLAVVALVHLVVWSILLLVKRLSNSSPRWVLSSVQTVPEYVIGNLVRVWNLFYYPLSLTAFFQLVLISRGPIPWYLTLMAVLILLTLLMGLPIYFCVIILKSKSSLTHLWEHKPTLIRLGPLYNTFDPYRAEALIFFIPLLAQRLLAGAVTGGAYSQPWIQIVLLLLADVVLLGLLAWIRPNYEPLRNVVYLAMSVFRLVAVFLLIPTTPQFTISSSARVALGWANIAIQGIVFASFIILIVRNLTILGIRLAKDMKQKHLTKKQLIQHDLSGISDDSSSIHSVSEMQDTRSMIPSRAAPSRLSVLSEYYYPPLPPAYASINQYLQAPATPDNRSVLTPFGMTPRPTSPQVSVIIDDYFGTIDMR
jgi:hypothetical protein